MTEEPAHPAQPAHHVRAAVAALAPVVVEGLDDDALESLVGAVATLRSAVEGLWLRVVGAAERRKLHERHHQRDTGQWLARVAGERVGTARRDVELAGTLSAAPQVAEAAAEHRLSKAQTAELARAALLPTEVIAELAHAAPGQSVDQLATAVRAARLAHDLPDPVAIGSCQIARNHDHVRVDATLDLVDGEALEIALDTYAASSGLPTELPFAERRARALAGLARFYLDHVEKPALTRVGRPHVLVLVDLLTLRLNKGGQARLASGAVISGDQARQLAADANITRVVTKGRSQVLDVGRTTRTVPPGLAKAVIARDRHCRFGDCHGAPWSCEIHHRKPWAVGGPTTLANLGLLCWFHHHLVHEGDPERLREDADGRWRLYDHQGERAAA